VLRAFSCTAVGREIMESALGMTAWRVFSAASKPPPFLAALRKNWPEAEELMCRKRLHEPSVHFVNVP
jgi:hypothetical protein